MFKVLRGKNLQTRAFCPARLSFRIEGETKNFSDKQKLKKFNTRLTLKEMLRGLLSIKKPYDKNLETIVKEKSH